MKRNQNLFSEDSHLKIIRLLSSKNMTPLRKLLRFPLQKFLSESLNHLEKMYPGNGSGVTSSQQSNLDSNKSKDGALMNDMKK